MYKIYHQFQVEAVQNIKYLDHFGAFTKEKGKICKEKTYVVRLELHGRKRDVGRFQPIGKGQVSER